MPFLRCTKTLGYIIRLVEVVESQVIASTDDLLAAGFDLFTLEDYKPVRTVSSF